MSHSWTYQQKVSAGFGVVVLLAAGTAGVAISSLRSVVAEKDQVIKVDTENLIGAAQLDAAIETHAASFRGYLASADQKFLDQREAATQKFHKVLADLEGRATQNETRSLVAGMRDGASDLLASEDNIVSGRLGSGGLAAALSLFDRDAMPKKERLAGEVRSFFDRERRLLDNAATSATEAASTATRLVVVLAAAALLFAIVTTVLLSRSLARVIESAVQHVQTSSAELQTTASQQATGAREAATSLNEITTTMSELMVTSRQISESAQQVARMAQDAVKSARVGEETVGQMQESIESIKHQVGLIVGHMLDLGKKSQQVGGILDIINELAEQTNILSINATIEAAGAGEAGKRFGVVGDEIRKLADRVTSSTREIRSLVEEIRSAVNTTVLATEGGSKAVDAGLRHFDVVKSGFKQIMGLVATTTEAAREIELSTKQQMTAVDQVNTAIAGAAQAARETEASTGQTAQTASQLAHLSQDLSQIVQPHAA